MLNKERLVLYFDGSCEPVNPGGVACCAWRLVADSGQIACDTAEICRGPEATNNLAEWHGLMRGLEHFKKQHADFQGRLVILGDSQLVINQLNKTWRCRKETLLPLMVRCHTLLEGVDWIAAWIRREENTETDRMSRKLATKDPEMGL